VCNNRSLSFDPFLDLSLACPAKTDPSDATGHSLIELVNNFLMEEKLSGANQLVCPRCRKLQDTKRCFHIVQWPQHLVLHLKRFNSRGIKSSAPVSLVESFQVQGKIRRDEMMLDHLLSRRYSGALGEEEANGNLLRYQLVGMVCHEGLADGGHYIAYVRNDRDGEWFLCNDSRISRAERRDVILSVARTAYLLFYDVVEK
jgi:ubiquitin C-terminal hydrolase